MASPDTTPTPETTPTPKLTFKCEEKGDNLEVTIVSCKGLPDLDGAFNLTDAYVIVQLGTKKERTKAVGGKLDPKFEKDNVFEFNIKDVALQSRIRFRVMDKDTFSPDDLIGKASIEVSKAKAKAGEEIELPLVGVSDGETHLSDAQTTAIYNLFSVLDPDNTGTIKPEFKKLVDENKAGKAAVLLDELKSYVDDKRDIDGNNEVSFGEFLEQFRGHENPGNTEHINDLTAELKIIVEKKEGKNKG